MISDDFRFSHMVLRQSLKHSPFDSLFAWCEDYLGLTRNADDFTDAVLRLGEVKNELSRTSKR